MNDTDSLLVFRLQKLRLQPRTVRGRCILFYASLSERPCARVNLFLGFTLFVLIHAMCFCIMLFACGEDQNCSLSSSQMLLPILLLSIYPLVLIPIIIAILIKDIIVKKEGIMAWHRNSLGLLLQRFLFTLIMMTSIVVFNNCISEDSDESLKTCMVHTGIPLIFVLLCVTCKVLCLRQQRIYLWTGFIVCLITQFIVFASVDGYLLVTPDEYEPSSGDGDHRIAQCFMFLPCVTFGLAADIQIIVSTYRYKPVAFKHLPFPQAKASILLLAYLGLLMSVVSYICCILVFGGIYSDETWRKLVYSCFIIKAVTWSPFVGLEFYDTLFEQVYHDVQFQLNIVRPGNQSKTPSPKQERRSKNKGKLQAIQEQQQETLLASEEENDQSGTKTTEQNESSQQLIKPTSQALADASNSHLSGPEPQFEQVKPVDFGSDQELIDMQKNRIVIQQESMTKTLTDNASSIVDQRSLFLGRNLNLTEYEKQVRKANGLPSREPSQSNSQIEEQRAASQKTQLVTAQQLQETTEYPFFGSVDQQTISLEQDQVSQAKNGDPGMTDRFIEAKISAKDVGAPEGHWMQKAGLMSQELSKTDQMQFSGVSDQKSSVGAEALRQRNASQNAESRGSEDQPKSVVSLNPGSLQSSHRSFEGRQAADLYNKLDARLNQDEPKDN